MIPMPPRKLRSERQRSSPRGKASRPEIVVAPVVVSPETDSNRAAAKPSCGRAK